MLYLCYKQKTSFQGVPLSPSLVVLDNVTVGDNGVLSKRSQFKTVSVNDLFGSLCVYDFSLDNILATGAKNLLNPVMMPNNDLASFDSSVAQVIKLYDEKAS